MEYLIQSKYQRWIKLWRGKKNQKKFKQLFRYNENKQLTQLKFLFGLNILIKKNSNDLKLIPFKSFWHILSIPKKEKNIPKHFVYARINFYFLQASADKVRRNQSKSLRIELNLHFLRIFHFIPVCYIVCHSLTLF